MKYVPLRDETKLLLDLHEKEIKKDYPTMALFIDSAVRGRLRGMGYKVEKELVVEHLKMLEKSSRYIKDRVKLNSLIKQHEERVRSAKRRLNDPLLREDNL